MDMKYFRLTFLSTILLLFLAMPSMAEYTSPRLDSLQLVEDSYNLQIQELLHQQDSIINLFRDCKTDSEFLVQHAALEKIEKRQGQIAKSIEKVNKEKEVERARLEHIERDSILSEKQAQVQSLSPVMLQGEHQGHAWVDLGLPSGTKWATYNVGTTKVHGVGTRVAWGEKASKKLYSPTTCPLFDVELPNYTGMAQYDLATDQWGEGWYTPTKEQWDELIKYCVWEYVMINGVYGVLFTSKKTHHYIFLPSTGITDDGTYKVKYTTYNLGYWSSTSQGSRAAYSYMANYEQGYMASPYKYNGYCVRAVCTVQAPANSDASDLPQVQSDDKPQVRMEDVKLTTKEYQLYELIMEYRASRGLPRIPVSPCLTHVAHLHVRDLWHHHPKGQCNLHSWSEYGDWSPCCYTNDHAASQCIWDKPGELTPYQGYGFEIATEFDEKKLDKDQPGVALSQWKSSPKHNAVIINLDPWTGYHWQSIGIGMYRGIAVVWFGREPDPIGYHHPLPPEPTTPVIVKQITTTTLSDGTVVSRTTSIPGSNEVSSAISVTHAAQSTTSATTPKAKSITKTSTKTKSSATVPYLQRYYNYSGKSFVNYFSLGATYSFADHHVLMSASLLDFRAGLFGMSPLAVEMSVRPFVDCIAYKPSLRVYVPVTKNLAVVPYGGVLVDASALTSPKGSYIPERDFYMNGFAGLALHLSAARRVPVELKAEYRFPIKQLSSAEFYPPGFYLSTQIYISKPFL